MNKIIKAQAGAIAIPVSRALPIVGGMSRALPIVGGMSRALPIVGGVPGVVASILWNVATDRGSANKARSQRHSTQSVAASDATRVARPVVVPTTRPTTLNLHRTATTKAHPIAITRTMSAASDSTGTAPRDTTGTAAPAARGTDDRSLREKLGDRIAGRGRQKPEPKPKNNEPKTDEQIIQENNAKIIKKQRDIETLKKTPGALFRVGWKPALGAAALGAAGAAGWALRGNKEVNDSTKVDKSTNKASTANVDLQKQQQDLINSRMQSNMAQPQIEY